MCREIPCDPQVLARWIDSDSNSWQYLSDPDPNPTDKREVADLLRLLGSRDADCIRAHYLNSWSTRRIARISGIKQPSVVERIHRAINKLRFLGSRPDYDLEIMLFEISQLNASIATKAFLENIIIAGTLHTASGYLNKTPTILRSKLAKMLGIVELGTLTKTYLQFLVAFEPRFQQTAQAPEMPKKSPGNTHGGPK